MMSEKLNLELPKKNYISEIYLSYKDVFQEILSAIELKLKSTLKLVSMPTFKTRIKSFNSYYKKVLRQKAQEVGESRKLVCLTDMIGIRVICAFLEDLNEVMNQIKQNFDVIEIEDKGANQSFREFGYESLHILIKIPADCMPVKNTTPALPENMVCEIQVRTILQDAWAEVEHELIYKSEFNPFDKPLRRKLASINASLSLADTIFQEIRDYQKKLQNELSTRRNNFYSKADLLTGDAEINEQSSGLKSENLNLENASIDDLVLQALHEHNVGNFAVAEIIYTKILESVPTPPDVVKGVIYKHRGMAYFAQGKYPQALDDFKLSVEKDPSGFRSLYYEGIVYSVMEKHKEAIECFNRSLEIDSFQSHVYYRRSLSYFNLGDYNNAMSDINNAVNLGLEDDDVKSLKAKIISKFDMKV
ncbi:MAG: (p)ppGpp synthetase [Spirochaetales bacterium]|nr:(p)ppGpp synthetase [Spirochaetia bacterium]MDD7013622.1 (p)ppGpp synthetase [Spirochaetales bacterium]